MNKKNTYTQQGDYLLPNLTLPEQPKFKIGIWGRRHERYIKQYHKLRYFNLLTSCIKFPLFLNVLIPNYHHYLILLYF